MTKADFPLFFSILETSAKSERRAEQALKDIEQINEALRLGKIRNVDYQDLKSSLGRAVESAWESHVGDPYFYAGKWQGQPRAAQDLYDSISIMGLHSVKAAAKKAQASLDQSEATVAMRAILAELLALAEAMDKLKPLVVKGRAPAAAPAPVNPDKIIKTCPCCLRQIAVVKGKMAHHGYERPGTGFQTRSCHGVNFPPLEISPAGLDWMIKQHESLLNRERRDLESLPNQETLTYLQRSPRELVTITPSDSRWPEVYARTKAGLESDIRSYESTLIYLGQRRKAWVAESPRDERLSKWYTAVPVA